MCLIADRKATAEFRKEHGRNGKITAYKVVSRIHSDCYTRYLLESYFHHFSWQTGVNEAAHIDTIYKGYRIPDGEKIYFGFHVYLNRKQAREFCGRDGETSTMVIMPVTCFIKDLVAVDVDGEAVFKKATLTPHNFKRLTKKEKKNEAKVAA